MKRIGDADRVEEPAVERLPPRGQAIARAPLAPERRRMALLIALAADFLQWVALPVFMAGAASPIVNALDIAVAIAMTMILGWHWAFLPTFIAELVPIVDLVPTWTLAVWIATRGRKDLPVNRPMR